MSREIHVHFLPDLVAAERLTDQTVAVIDVLRATTTIVHALAAGARAVIPCLDVEQARRIASERGGALLGGERGGLTIEGFDLGNSPAAYRPEVVAGKTIVFTTTNGTRALDRCRSAAHVLIAAFVNCSAVCDSLTNVPVVHLLCSGADAAIAREDVLLAGAMVDRMAGQSGDNMSLNDQALIAQHAWRQVDQQSPSGSLATALEDSAGARNLMATNQHRDIALAAEVDRFDIVPQVDGSSGEIT